jgi:sialic acid synthase SpsE
MIIAEIGFNHMGKTHNVFSLLGTLLKTDVDAVTFQVRERKHRIEKPHRYFPDEFFPTIISKIKGEKKKVGIAIADIGYIPFFEDLDVDFYKVIRNDITSFDLIDRLSDTGKRVYVSTGMASEEDISYFVDYIREKSENFRLVHTQLSYSLSDCNLKSIDTMKKYGIPVAYGSHCRDEISIFMSLCYNPSDILFYVKGEEKIKYPDDEHSIRISEVSSLVDKIRESEMSIGTGVKKEMKNKIEVKS